MKACLFSNRIPKLALKTEDVAVITDTLLLFNKGVRTAYSLMVQQYRGRILEKSIHMLIKEKFCCNDYYANSMVGVAKGVFQSNLELQKLYVKEKEEKILHIENKIKETKETLLKKEVLLDQVISYYKTQNPCFNFYKNPYISVKEVDGTFLFTVRKVEYSLYNYEVLYLKPEIKRLKQRIKQLEYGKSRVIETRDKIIKEPHFSCFGGKSFFKKQYTVYQKNHEVWKDLFHQKRNSTMQISGRKDAKQGNFVFRYNDYNLSFTVPTGEQIILKEVFFPYGQHHVLKALHSEYGKKAVAWELIDKGTYYIVKVIIEIPEQERKNDSTVAGVIGLDINVDHFALSNVSATGNLIGYKIIPLPLKGKTTNQTTNIIGNAAKEVLAYCLLHKKPLVLEDLKLEKKKVTMKYGNKKANHAVSTFAYQKMLTALYTRADKDETKIFSVNPAYTSQIGKLKYMKQKGISIHVAASYVIGRRGLGFKERIPEPFLKYMKPKLRAKHNWSQWSYLTRQCSTVPTHCFYKKIPFETCNTIKQVTTFLSD